MKYEGKIDPILKISEKSPTFPAKNIGTICRDISVFSYIPMYLTPPPTLPARLQLSQIKIEKWGWTCIPSSWIISEFTQTFCFCVLSTTMKTMLLRNMDFRWHGAGQDFGKSKVQHFFYFIIDISVIIDSKSYLFETAFKYFANLPSGFLKKL